METEGNFYDFEILELGNFGIMLSCGETIHENKFSISRRILTTDFTELISWLEKLRTLIYVLFDFICSLEFLTG